MTTEELIHELEHHETIGKAPRHELEWIATHGTPKHFQPGDIVSSRAEVVNALFIVLQGRLSHHADHGAGRRKVMEWIGGEVTGLLPYSRLKYPPGDTVADEPTYAVLIARDDMQAMISNCYEVTATLVHVMTDRARRFTSSELRDEKLVSLGKLASGLAHELNNPASAAMRDAKLLTQALSSGDSILGKLAGARFSDSQLEEIGKVRNLVLASDTSKEISGLELSDREEALNEWCENHHVDCLPVADLACTSISVETLDQLARSLNGDSLSAALQWIAEGIHTRSLAHNINRAVTRIHTLVTSVKGFTHMDRAPVSEPVDVTKGLTDTVAILTGKAKGKSVDITLNAAPNLPPIRGIGVEVNQVWMNLIDNAVDAAGSGGHVEVTAAKDGDNIIVRVLDDGDGIPDETIGRIFDPFFTTKSVGEGTGLGLDIVRRVVQWHGGEVDVESRPGHTLFTVKIPIYKQRD